MQAAQIIKHTKNITKLEILPRNHMQIKVGNANSQSQENSKTMLKSKKKCTFQCWKVIQQWQVSVSEP